MPFERALEPEMGSAKISNWPIMAHPISNMPISPISDPIVHAGHLSLPSQSEVLSLLSLLERYLPYSLPLYRRLQFYLAHPSHSTGPPHAQIWQASAQDIGIHRTQSSSRTSSELPLQDATTRDTKEEVRVPWLAAHVDLSRSGETQVWIFANWECFDQDAHQQPPLSPRETEARRTLLQAFLEFVYTRCVPLMPSETPASYKCFENFRGSRRPYSPSAALIGSCHETVRSLIPNPALGKVNSHYLKYIFPSTSHMQSPTGPIASTQDVLPRGYRYGALRQPCDLQVALDRTSIPRTVETMAILPSRAIFYEDEPDPVAWGFVGIDASLTTLHTEHEHRRKNLAVSLAKELLRIQAAQFKTPGCKGGEDQRADSRSSWGHADVSEDNTGSQRVMAKAGGWLMWRNCWVQVELERLLGEGGLWSGGRSKSDCTKGII
jgi:hypothetical protein